MVYGDERFNMDKDSSATCFVGAGDDGVEAWYLPSILADGIRQHLISGEHRLRFLIGWQPIHFEGLATVLLWLQLGNQ